MGNKRNKKQKRNRKKKRENKRTNSIYNNESEFEKNNPDNINQNIVNEIHKPKGLVNLGLTCYMNSLLQCFFYINKLREYFISNIGIFNEDKPLCKELSNVLYELKYGNEDYIKPEKFKKLIGKNNPLFSGCKACDAKDLYFNLIDNLLTELNDNDSDESSSFVEIDFSNKNQVFEETKKETNEKIIINQIFLGYYFTRYKCPNSDNFIYSFQTESFVLFNLDNIKNFYKKKNIYKDKLSLDLCFQYYIAAKKNCSFYCSICKEEQINFSEDRIYNPPEILTIILDRGKGKKFKEKVEFGKELDLNKYIENDLNKNYLYKLICICTHSGESASWGHYTARCLNNDGKYYYFSDTYVEEIKNENELYENEPYLLFYKKIEIDNIKYNRKEINDTQINDINSSCNTNLNTESIIEDNENNDIDIINNNIIKNRNSNSDIYSNNENYVSIEIKNWNNSTNEIKEKTNKNDKNDIIYSKNNNNQSSYNSKYKILFKYIFILISISLILFIYKDIIKEKTKINSSQQKLPIQKNINLYTKLSNKYIINSYFLYQKTPIIKRLIINEPNKIQFKNKKIVFEINFNKLKFKDLIKRENRIYHVKIFKKSDIVSLDFKYDINISLYDNFNKYFNFIFELLIFIFKYKYNIY